MWTKSSDIWLFVDFVNRCVKLVCKRVLRLTFQAYTCTLQALIRCKFTVLSRPPKKCTMSDLREYAIAGLFSHIFAAYFAMTWSAYFEKKISAFFWIYKNAFKNRLDKHWTDMADKALLLSPSSYKYKYNNISCNVVANSHVDRQFCGSSFSGRRNSSNLSTTCQCVWVR